MPLSVSRPSTLDASRPLQGRDPEAARRFRNLRLPRVSRSDPRIQGGRMRSPVARRPRPRRRRPRQRPLQGRRDPNPALADSGSAGPAHMTAHPYDAELDTELKREPLDAIGVAEIEELFVQIPATTVAGWSDLRPSLGAGVARRPPRPAGSQRETCELRPQLPGWRDLQHHVPAIVDEIARRSEFLTPCRARRRPTTAATRPRRVRQRAGWSWSAWTSSACPSTAGAAQGFAIRMAARLTRPATTFVQRTISPERLAVIRDVLRVVRQPVPSRSSSSRTTRRRAGSTFADLQAKLTPRTAAVLFENPVLPGHRGECSRDRGARARGRRRDDRRRRSDLARRRSPAFDLRRRHRRRLDPSPWACT